MCYVRFSALLKIKVQILMNADILLSAMWELLSDGLLHISPSSIDNSSNAVLVLEVDAFDVVNYGRRNVVADSELDLQ